MKQTKQLLMLVLVSTTSICVGCSGQVTPKTSIVAEKGTLDAHKAEVQVPGKTFEGEGFTFTASNGWEKNDAVAMEDTISLMKSATESMSVVLMEAEELKGMSTADYKIMVEQNLSQEESLGIIVDKVELKTMPYGDIVYVEAQIKMTQELIDLSIDSGLLTQEALDARGGAEAYIKNMSMGEVYIYHLLDGEIYIIKAQSQGGTAADIADAALFVAENTTF